LPPSTARNRARRSTYRRSRNEATLRERLSSGISWLSDECRPLLLWATFIGADASLRHFCAGRAA
jgi:hypothetical protein